MLTLLAPSKTMDFTTPVPFAVPQFYPEFIQEATVLAQCLRTLGENELITLMKISPALAVDVRAMYREWHSYGNEAALWAYKGDAYKGMKANILDEPGAWWAQRHFVIMSGLYGIVRPFDQISRYRLEMSTGLKTNAGKDLYAFWGDQLAQYVAQNADGIVCVLSSDEYARPVIKHLPHNTRIVTPIFYDKKSTSHVGIAPIYSKMMRGVMARWMIDERIETPEVLKSFSGQGYEYDSARSRPNSPAFYREKMTPLIF